MTVAILIADYISKLIFLYENGCVLTQVFNQVAKFIFDIRDDAKWEYKTRRLWSIVVQVRQFPT